MKLSKSQRSNLIFLIIFLIVFFTPLRGKLQEFTSKIASTAPSIEKSDYQTTVDDYNWNLIALDGSPYNFREAKGKVVFLNFWATWCPPCRAELPAIQNLYEAYMDRVEFVFVSNEDAQVISQFLEQKAYTIPSYQPKSRQPKEFSVSSIPATFILNKKGAIVLHKIGPADWDANSFKEELDALIAE